MPMARAKRDDGTPCRLYEPDDEADRADPMALVTFRGGAYLWNSGRWSVVGCQFPDSVGFQTQSEFMESINLTAEPCLFLHWPLTTDH